MVKSEDAVSPLVDLSMASNRSSIDSLCRYYNYPADVGRLLEQLVASVRVPGTKSIVLSGSASRGELVFAQSATGLRLFSDLELFVVADEMDPQEKRRAMARLNPLEQHQWSVGARTFHTDVEFMTMQEWPRKQARFQAWETAQSGWVLFGENIINLIQADVEPRAAIQSSLNRLWYLLLYLPERLLRRCPTEDDLQAFNYSLNRAVLDFPLWLLVHRGILVAGFAGRQKCLREHREEFRRQEFPIDELLELVDSAMHSRQFPELTPDARVLYEKVLSWYPRMVSWTLNMSPNEDSGNFPAAIRKHNRKLYAPLNWKRHAWQVRILTAIGVQSSPWLAVNWLREKKQVIVTTFLWQMHRAATQYLAGREREAAECLQLASRDMGLLWPAAVANSAPQPFIEGWIRLRRCFFDFVMLFYRGLREKESYYEFVLDNGKTD